MGAPTVIRTSLKNCGEVLHRFPICWGFIIVSPSGEGTAAAFICAAARFIPDIYVLARRLALLQQVLPRRFPTLAFLHFIILSIISLPKASSPSHSLFHFSSLR